MSKKRKTALQPAQTTKKPSLFRITPLIILLVVVLSGLTVSYLNFYPNFLPRSLVFSLDNLVAQIPLLPKTAKQIVSRSLLRNQGLKSYDYLFSGRLEEDKNPLVGINLSGKINKLGLFNSDFQGQLSLTGLGDSSSSLDLVSAENTLYFKILSGTSLLGNDLTGLGKNWQKVDLAEFKKSLGVKTRSDKEVISDVNKQLVKIWKELPANFFTYFSLNTEKDSYHLKATLPKEMIQKTIKTEETKVLNSLTLEFWVDKKSNYLTKLDLDAEVDLAKLNSSPVKAGKTNIKITYTISGLNQTKTIKEVDGAETIANPLELTIKLLKNSPENGFFEITSKSGELSTNFLTLERLVKVVQLLPKAI